jgi:hypothetical protein
MKLLRNQLLFIIVLISCTCASGFLFFDRWKPWGGPVDCCAPCGAAAFDCGDCDVQFQAGICPINWNHADRIVSASSVPFVTSSNLFLFRHPHFSTVYQLPWIVGAQAGYAWSDHVRLYVEVNYLQAKSKNDVRFFTDSTPSLSGSITFTTYKLFDAFVGGRYYTNRCWCDRVSFFLGGKIGLTRHHDNQFELVIGMPQPGNQTILREVPAFDQQTVISGGINGGLDICCGCWSLVITGEVVISKRPKAADNLMLVTPIANVFTTIFLGKVGPELRFPITAGIRYTF